MSDPERHTRTTIAHGPDYCAECSHAAQDWVKWPCLGAVSAGTHSPYEYREARGRLVAAIPEPEWEPTADMVDRGETAYSKTHRSEDSEFIVEFLKAMHREGLL